MVVGTMEVSNLDNYFTLKLNYLGPPLINRFRVKSPKSAYTFCQHHLGTSENFNLMSFHHLIIVTNRMPEFNST